MEQLQILKYFNSKCENESPLVVKTTLQCTRWIGNFGWCVMIISTQCKQRAVKCELDSCQVYEIGALQKFSFPHDRFIKILLTYMIYLI